jgi:hypothetical protein
LRLTTAFYLNSHTRKRRVGSKTSSIGSSAYRSASYADQFESEAIDIDQSISEVFIKKFFHSEPASIRTAREVSFNITDDVGRKGFNEGLVTYPTLLSRPGSSTIYLLYPVGRRVGAGT